MTKNQKIVEQLRFLADHLHGAGCCCESIRGILLEPEKATSPATPYTITKNPGETADQAIVRHMTEKYTGQDQCTPADRKNPYPHTVSVPTKFSVIVGETFYLKRIDENASCVFYKLTAGPDRGAVFVVSKKNGKVLRDGRYVKGEVQKSRFGFNTSALALVSKDSDGKDYVKSIRLARAWAGKSPKVVRYYRPGRQHTWYWRRKCNEKPFTHCAIYAR